MEKKWEKDVKDFPYLLVAIQCRHMQRMVSIVIGRVNVCLAEYKHHLE